MYRMPSPEIQGWTTPSELNWLYEQSRNMSSVAEIGSWKGRSTHALLSGCRGRVTSVDHFQGSPTELETTHAEAQLGGIYEEFRRNLHTFPNLSVLAMDSAAAASQTNTFDMVFIDGGHDYDSVLRDLKTWGHKATRLLCGHDRFQEGVPHALAAYGLDWEMGPGSIWFARIGEHRQKALPKATKAIWTLNVDNYEPRVTAYTYPLLKAYARKIGADFRVIDRRCWPALPPVYEKLQLHTLGREYDWNIYIDSDALVHPDFFDPTEHLSKDTVAHNGSDLASIRWQYDDYFRRDGRHIGSCNWFTVASNWCLDIWKPLEDLSYDQAVTHIHPTLNERNTVITREHLIDDYVLSRNIARYGLKFTTIEDLLRQIKRPSGFLWHLYTIPAVEKVEQLKITLQAWGL